MRKGICCQEEPITALAGATRDLESLQATAIVLLLRTDERRSRVEGRARGNRKGRSQQGVGSDVEETGVTDRKRPPPDLARRIGLRIVAVAPTEWPDLETEKRCE